MFEMWDVWDVGCFGCGMLDVRDVGCLGCGMFSGMWDVDLQNVLHKAAGLLKTLFPFHVE